MLKCPKCGTRVEDTAAVCWNCAAEFERDESGMIVPDETPVERETITRPHGGSLMGGGWALIAGSVLLYLLAGTSGGSLEAMATSWTLILLSGGLFQIGLFLAIAGIIVRAIWFLPGEDTKAPPRP